MQTDSPSSTVHPGRSRAALVCLWLANVALSCAIASAYLRHAPPEPSSAQRLQLAAGLITSAGLVGLLPLCASVLAASVLPARLAGALAALLFTLTQAVLYADTVVYGLFRYHFNGLVWNAFVTPGADEAVHLPYGEIAVVLALTLGVSALQYALWRALVSSCLRTRGRLGLPRPFALALGVLLAGGAVYVGQHVRAELGGDRRILALARLFPAMPTLSFRSEGDGDPPIALAPEDTRLRYPLAAPRIDPSGPRPDIVLIVVDSLRADMLDAARMPHTSRFAEESRVFRDHQSAGNGTRVGLFGMLYGLHGTYWWPVLAERRSPVLIDALVALGYETRVLTSASMSYPELASTAFASIADTVEDRIPAERPGGRDDGVATRFEAWLAERDRSRPFFALLLLDAPHQVYAFPEEHALFRPYAEALPYVGLSSGDSPQDLLLAYNRYQNAVHYADATVDRCLAALERSGALAESVIVITGDHGEEFRENGFYGHTSNFTREQLRVPLLLRASGIAPGEEHAPTSHLDLPATLLELLGADPAQRAEWTLGGNLLAPDPERARVAAGWHIVALEAAEGRTLVMPESGAWSDIDVFDPSWRLVLDVEPILRSESGALERLALECRRFLR